MLSVHFCFSSLVLHSTDSLPLQIDEWLEYAPILSYGSEFENACTHIDKYLVQCTFLVGHSLSIADIAIWSGLAGTHWR